MGMFDEVNFKTTCPKCGADVDGFQSKDLDCTMSVVEPDSLTNFYSSCQKCKTWIEFDRSQPRQAKRAVPLTEEEVLALGFVKRVEPAHENVDEYGRYGLELDPYSARARAENVTKPDENTNK